MTEKIILDTDIGSDIDDAVCLAYLLAQQRCELLGITTVSGEPVARAAMASAMCKLAGKDVPIYPGMQDPLLGKQWQPNAPQATALSRWPHRTDFPSNQAIDFLRATIRRHPGEVTLLAIGPMTNIAVLFAMDPEIPRLLKRLVLMCGFFAGTEEHGRDGVEWNALCDPHAASIVYRAAAPIHWSIGLDVTTKVTMHKDEARSRFSHKLLQPVLDFAGVWFERWERIVFHDPLAATLIFEPSLCTMARGQVQVGLCGDKPGLTTFTPDAAGPHHVAMTVDPSRFFDHYFGVFE